MSSLGKRFVAALIDKGTVSELLKYGPIEHLFKGSESELFGFVAEFAKKYHALPSSETIEAHTGEELPGSVEPHGYYYDLLQLRHTEHELKRAMKQASDLLQPNSKDPQAALEAISEAVMQLVATKNHRLIVDFREAYDVIVGDYVTKYKQEDGHGMSMGWPTLDVMTGGLVEGDLVSMVGRPAKGKTWQMLYCAHHAWRSGYPMMFVSMEMSPLAIQQRLTAMHASVPMTKLKNAELSTKHLKKMKESLIEIKGFDAPFWVVDGNFSATVEDVWMLARQLKPRGIYVDGGYLLKHPTERDRYKRVAENADLLKQELSPLAPTVVSWQFAKAASKKKKGEKATGDDIGYSDVIYQVSSLVMALLEEDSVETIKQRLIDILKGRNGEVGQFRTRWDFQQMDFTEIVEQALEELKFV